MKEEKRSGERHEEKGFLFKKKKKNTIKQQKKKVETCAHRRRRLGVVLNLYIFKVTNSLFLYFTTMHTVLLLLEH